MYYTFVYCLSGYVMNVASLLVHAFKGMNQCCLSDYSPLVILLRQSKEMLHHGVSVLAFLYIKLLPQWWLMSIPCVSGIYCFSGYLTRIVLVLAINLVLFCLFSSCLFCICLALYQYNFISFYSLNGSFLGSYHSL